MTWASLTPDEKRAAIRDGVAAGLSARLIGETIGATKGQIIGFAYRHKVKLRPSGQNSHPYRQPRPVAVQRPHVERRAPPKMPVTSQPMPRIAPPPVVKCDPLPFPREVMRGCPYPLWDDSTPWDQRKCCGAPKEPTSPFCPACMAICYHPLPQKRRAA